MSKETQSFRLFNLLKAAPDGANKHVLAQQLGININSVPVYIHELKVSFKADIESVRSGKEVVAYKLLNADKIKVHQYRKGTYVPSDKPKTEQAAVTTAGVDEDMTNYTDKEWDDLKSDLGLETCGFKGWD